MLDFARTRRNILQATAGGVVGLLASSPAVAQNNSTGGDDSPPTLSFRLEPTAEADDAEAERTYDIVVSGATEGVAAYEIPVELTDPAIATITDAELVAFGGPFSETEITDDGATVSLIEATGDSSAPGETFTIARVTVTKGETEGATELRVADRASVTDSSNDVYYNIGSNGSTTIEVDKNESAPGLSFQLEPTSEANDTESERTYDLAVSGVSDGIAAYSLTIESTDPAIAAITDVKLVAFGSGESNVDVADDGATAAIEGGTDGFSVSGETVTVGRVTVTEGDAGTAELQVAAGSEVESTAGEVYEIYDTGSTPITIEPTGPAPEVSVEIEQTGDAATAESERVYDLVVNGATNGISGYDITIESTAPEIATITDTELVAFGGPGSKISTANDGATVRVQEVTDDASPSGPTFTIARLTVTEGETAGSTELRVAEGTEVESTNDQFYAVSDTSSTTIEIGTEGDTGVENPTESNNSAVQTETQNSNSSVQTKIQSSNNSVQTEAQSSSSSVQTEPQSSNSSVQSSDNVEQNQGGLEGIQLVERLLSLFQ